MKHYVELPRRLPSARKLARTRSRALPFVIALPLVAVLWVTIGLPILSSETSASVSNRRSRDVVFEADGSGSRGSGHGDQGSQTVSVATFSPDVLHAVGVELGWIKEPSAPKSKPPRRRPHRQQQTDLVSRIAPGNGNSHGPIIPAVATKAGM